MDTTFLVGLFGSIVLIIGVAYPIKSVSHPALSAKNWLFTVGNASMFLYAYLNFLAGGSVFFIYLQVLIAVSTVLMMLNTRDAFDAPVLGIAGVVLIIQSLRLFEGYGTVLFVVGLVLLGLGFAFQMGSLRRNVALGVGSAVIAVFSYLDASWIFFWLNVFFAAFSGYHVLQVVHRKR